MPVYQLKCKSCGQEFEAICPVADRDWQACECGASAGVIPAVRGPNCSNEDAGWISTIREVVDKESKDPYDVAMCRPNPTRSDYRAWMKAKGIRHLEPGEKPRREEIDVRRHTDLIMRMKQERERIHVR
jgi:putative FmdB family regulatory protein